MDPSSVFPTAPQVEQHLEASAGKIQRRPVERVHVLYRLARRADWLSQMWEEFPSVAVRHRSYARRMRSALSSHWQASKNGPQNASLWEIRRLAWRAYRRSMGRISLYPHGELGLAAQKLKVDVYWARVLWETLGSDPARISALRARDYELQQLCDAFPVPTATPGLMTLIRRFLRWLWF